MQMLWGAHENTSVSYNLSRAVLQDLIPVRVLHPVTYMRKRSHAQPGQADATD